MIYWLRRRFSSNPHLKNPLLVYQMGKVGSSSVYKSLKAMRLPVPVTHVHLLNHLDDLELRIRASRTHVRSTMRIIRKGRRLARSIASGRQELDMISLVRDPVARNISAFFQNLDEVMPGYSPNGPGQDLYKVRKAFLEDYDHEAPRYWFDSQMRDVFGLDVFSRAFPHQRGWDYYETERIRLVVIRLENLADCVDEALEDGLGIRDFRLLSRNVGSNKAYSDLYATFNKSVQIPEEYIDRMYDTQYARHFYTDQERARFKQRWLRTQDASDVA